MLSNVRQELIALAQQPEFQSHAWFPDAAPGKGVLYQLHGDLDDAYALYVNVCGAQVVSPPHDHTTWAVIAGVEGVEHNYFYRLDEGQRAVRTGQKDIRAGEGVALMPDDVHSINTSNQDRVVCLHFYGVGLPKQTARRAFGELAAAGYAPQPEIMQWK